MSATYILYSPKLDRYYIGHTSDDLEERLRRHNSNHKGFTGQASDWTISYFESYKTKEAAYSRERQLKSWKSRKKIEQLVKSGS